MHAPCTCCKYISSAQSPFSDRVPFHNIPSSGVLMKGIGAEFLRTDALPGIRHMHGMYYQIRSKYYTLVGTELIQLYKFVCTIPTQNININLRSKLPFSRLLRHTWVKAVMLF